MTIHDEKSSQAAPISVARQTPVETLMAPGAAKRQSMRGFDDDYVDIVDYIVRCTHKIWEERGVGLIYTHYNHNVVVHTSDGTIYGRDAVVAGSIRTMNAFADLRLYADDVIWSGNDVDGFHSSHRISWAGRNTGYSVYGPPTGRKVQRYGVAQCFVRENRIVEEWICRDEMALVRQLGYDPHELAQRMVEGEAAGGRATLVPPTLGEPEQVRGQRAPAPAPALQSDQDVEGFVRRNFHEIWNWRLLNKIDAYFESNLLAWIPSARKLYGRADYRAWILSIIAAFSDLALTVDHVCWLGNMDKGSVAIRWYLQGTHDGPGWYGNPTGKRIFILGITHQEIVAGKIAQEWTCFDEFALLKQIYAPDEGG